jgi:hypothetical protein
MIEYDGIAKATAKKEKNEIFGKAVDWVLELRTEGKVSKRFGEIKYRSVK